jgi:hypothetical protein
MSVLLFAMNPAAKNPFHLLLADVVEALEGRLALLQVLNQLGACAAKDTLNRYIEKVGSAIMEEGPLTQLPPGCESCFITCINIDNADKTAVTSLKRFGRTVADMHVVSVQIHCKPSLKLPKEAMPEGGPQRESNEEELACKNKRESLKVDTRAWTLTEGKPGGSIPGVEKGSLRQAAGLGANVQAPFQGPFTDLRAAGATPEKIF